MFSALIKETVWFKYVRISSAVIQKTVKILHIMLVQIQVWKALEMETLNNKYKDEDERIKINLKD